MNPRLKLEGLHLARGSRVLLESGALELAPGERVALVGGNGAGKSTLLAAIAGSFRPRRGRIQLDGANVAAWSPGRRARAGMRRGFQGRALPPTLDDATVARLARAHDLDPAVSRRFAGLALALTGNPRLLLLDEAFAGFSPEERAAGLARLNALTEAGTAILWVEHDHGWLRGQVDRAVELSEGRLQPAHLPSSPEASEATSAVFDGPEPRLGFRLALPGPSGALIELGPGAARWVGWRPSPAEGRGLVHGPATLDGVPCPPGDARRRAGWATVLAEPELVPDLDAASHCALAVDPTEARRLWVQLLPDAGPRWRVPAKALSGGERRLLALALALSGAPRALVLEDATVGLASEARRALEALLQARLGAGAAVLFLGTEPYFFGPTLLGSTSS